MHMLYIVRTINHELYISTQCDWIAQVEDFLKSAVSHSTKQYFFLTNGHDVGYDENMKRSQK